MGRREDTEDATTELNEGLRWGESRSDRTHRSTLRALRDINDELDTVKSYVRDLEVRVRALEDA